jgi:hypothetical protein
MNSTNDFPPVPGRRPSDPESATAATSVPPIRKRRRWWLYLLVSLGSLVFLAIVAVALLVGYWKSLITNYTSTQPAPLPHRIASGEAIEDLKTRWGGFWQAVMDDRAEAPFKLSADDLNAVLANIPQLQDRLLLSITNDRIMGQFSVPLDQAKQKELRGRFINGTAHLNLVFEDGWLTAQALDLKANGKAIPAWLQKKAQKENILKDLDKNAEVTAFLHKLHNVEVKDGFVILTP